MEIQAQVQKSSFVNQRNDRERERGGGKGETNFPYYANKKKEIEIKKRK